MGDSSEACACRPAGIVQPRPQVLGIRTVVEAKGFVLLCCGGIAVRNHYPVQVGTPW